MQFNWNEKCTQNDHNILRQIDFLKVLFKYIVHLVKTNLQTSTIQNNLKALDTNKKIYIVVETIKYY